MNQWHEFNDDEDEWSDVGRRLPAGGCLIIICALSLILWAVIIWTVSP